MTLYANGQTCYGWGNVGSCYSLLCTHILCLSLLRRLYSGRPPPLYDFLTWIGRLLHSKLSYPSRHSRKRSQMLCLPRQNIRCKSGLETLPRPAVAIIIEGHCTVGGILMFRGCTLTLAGGGVLSFCHRRAVILRHSVSRVWIANQDRLILISRNFIKRWYNSHSALKCP